MKPTTLARAVADGATVILRGHGLAYSPGAVAYRLQFREDEGLGAPGLGGWFVPVQWRDGYGWQPASNWNGRTWEGIPAGELVTPVDYAPGRRPAE